MADKPELSEELKAALDDIITHFEDEDKYVRERQLRLWKKLKYLWAGFHRIWWSETAHDWRVYDEQMLQQDDASYYDKPVNVFRAYLESIIAALSATIPSINSVPDDANSELDIVTAKAADNIAELVYRHNDAPLLWVHALFTFCTEGMVAAYHYDHKDKSYGTYDKEKRETTVEDQQQEVCSLCKQQLVDEELMLNEEDEYDPGDDDVDIKDALSSGKKFCANCAQLVDPELQIIKIPITRLVGVTQEPKTRQCIEVYGGLNVKVAAYARTAKETPYLRYAYECHYSVAAGKYPQLYDKDTNSLRVGPGAENYGPWDTYERWARLNPQYYGEYPNNVVTVREVWLRPDAFWVCTDEDKRNALKKRFPDGVKVCLINDEYVESCNESLDDHWTLAQNPLSDYLQHDPLGILLTAVQEITNDLLSLILQTIEHGIPQTFADPKVLNFKQYSETEVSPGAIFPGTPQPGKSMQDAFYEVKTATLSPEVQPFAEKIQQLGEFVSGALPAIFGVMQGKTAAQDSMSRNQALQRLQNTWKMLNYWWKNTFGKVIPSYMECVKEQGDEHFTKKVQSGEFITTFIKKAELEGKIGSIELESEDNLPLTWGQRKDVVMQLLNTANPAVIAALTDPNNAEYIASAIGLDDLAIPGEDDRLKQLDEIHQLLMSEPMPAPESPDGFEPSVQVDPTLDNNQVESVVCRHWLVSPVGRQTKIDNPAGYQNVLLHYKGHMQAMLMAEQGAAQNPVNQPTTGESAPPKPLTSTSGTMSQQTPEIKHGPDAIH